MNCSRICCTWCAGLLLVIAGQAAQRQSDRVQPRSVFDEPFGPSRDHPAIAYSSRRGNDAILRLNRRILAGQVTLTPEKDSGHLRSLLAGLDVPVESQVMVFSKTSFQGQRIGPDNPRSVFFNDSVAVAWPRRGIVEAAAHDPEQGVVFYILGVGPTNLPEFKRQDTCLHCHISPATLDVPGVAVGSVVPEATGIVAAARTVVTDHRTPMDERWGGWFVTGRTVTSRHRGNLVADDPEHPRLNITADSLKRDSLKTLFDTSGYLSEYSDVVALMVLDHQTRMINLLTRFGWEVRVARHEGKDLDPLLGDGARELVDYMLFVDEAPLGGAIAGSSGFAAKFARAGPRDSKGRSLRDIDLTRRLMRHPCSYLIYSEAFDALPRDAREAIYRRMWTVLSGQERDPRYLRLTAEDRANVIDILRDTKPDLPGFFRGF